MKKTSYLIILILSVLILSGCTMEKRLTEEPTETNTIAEIIADTQPYIVKIDDVLYQCGFMKADDYEQYITPENYIGAIKDKVQDNEIPKENLTSNFLKIDSPVYRVSDTSILVQSPQDENVYFYCKIVQ